MNRPVSPAPVSRRLAGDPGRPVGRVIRAAEVDRLIASTAAHDAIHDLHRQAVAAAEAARAEGRQAGLAAGWRDGLRHALDTLEPAMREARDRLREIEPLLQSLVIEAIRRILGDLPPDERRRRIVIAALDEAAAAVGAVLRVPPPIAGQVRATLAAWQAEGCALAVRAVEPDPTLTGDEMVLEAGGGRVHVGPGQQLDRLRDALGGDA